MEVATSGPSGGPPSGGWASYPSGWLVGLTSPGQAWHIANSPQAAVGLLILPVIESVSLLLGKNNTSPTLRSSFPTKSPRL